jgi:hypothetical protein
MKVMKKMCSFAMLALITMPAACSFATVVSLYSLPDSTFAQTQNNWQGQKEYTEGDLKIHVEFSVYDTEDLANKGEQDLAGALNLSGRYIYAYQVFNYYPTESAENVIAFQLLDIDKNAIPESAFNGDTGGFDDSSNGVAPTPQVSIKQGIWTFVPGDLAPGIHSWFLVFSSDVAPVKGDFKVSQNEADFPTTPEPATITSFGIAAGLFAAMRKKKS